MELVLILLRQIAQMLILSVIGYYLFKKKYITENGLKTIGNVLIHMILPCVIIRGFLVERDAAHLTGLGLSALLAVISMAIALILSRLVFKKDPVGQFASAFANPGFFGLPLIIASIADGGVFYAASYIACVNILQYTYGIFVMTGDKRSMQPKAVLKAPFFIAIVIGLLLFFISPPLPALFTETLNTIASINTPLAMFTIGCYMSFVNIPKMFTKRSLYMVSLIRLVVTPLVMLPVLMLVPDRFYDIKVALMIVTACPVGSNAAVYAQLHGQDYGYAVETVVISTLLSVITIPSLLYLFQIVA